MGRPDAQGTASPAMQWGRSRGTGLLLFVLALAFYYLSYRYPLQINSSTTSPTYSDTPLSLQLGKYVVFGVGLLAVLVRSIITSLPAAMTGDQLIDFILVLFVLCQSFLVGGVTKNPALIESGVFFSAVMPYFLFRYDRIDLRPLRRTIWWFLLLTIGIDIVQVALFGFFHRLPALAYRGSVAVRFGGIWDDPNALGVFTAFILGVVTYSSLKVTVKVCLVVVTSILLLLTQSLTGIVATTASLPIGLFFLSVLRQERRWLGMILAIIVLYTAIFLVLKAVFFGNGLSWELATAKGRSVTQHLRDLSIVTRANILQYLGLAPLGLLGESGYVNMVVNHGVFFALAYVALGIRAAVRLAKIIIRTGNRPGIEVCYGAYFFLLAFYIGLTNLPLDTVFPLNAVLAAVVILSYAGIQVKEDKAAEEAVA